MPKYQRVGTQMDRISPVRVQRKRTKGFSLQTASPNGLPVVYVGRPTIWGNPYSFGQYDIGMALVWFREAMSGSWNPKVVGPWFSNEQYNIIYGERQTLVNRFRAWNMSPLEAARAYLRGKNLCCWCPLTQACHADILLEIANQ